MAAESIPPPQRDHGVNSRDTTTTPRTDTSEPVNDDTATRSRATLVDAFTRQTSTISTETHFYLPQAEGRRELTRTAGAVCSRP
jgi:hypothetical protein